MLDKTYTHWVGKTVTSNTDRIEVEGHTGTWYVANEAEYNGKALFLLEHEEYRDEAACVIVDKILNSLLTMFGMGLMIMRRQCR